MQRTGCPLQMKYSGDESCAVRSLRSQICCLLHEPGSGKQKNKCQWDTHTELVERAQVAAGGGGVTFVFTLRKLAPPPSVEKGQCLWLAFSLEGSVRLAVRGATRQPRGSVNVQTSLSQRELVWSLRIVGGPQFTGLVVSAEASPTVTVVHRQTCVCGEETEPVRSRLPASLLSLKSMMLRNGSCSPGVWFIFLFFGCYSSVASLLNLAPCLPGCV